MTGADDSARLLAGIVNREHGAFDTLYQRLHGYVLSIALRLLRRPHDAEDVAQDVFLALWCRPPRGTYGHASLLAWLASTARNTCLLRFRAECREQPLVPEQPPLDSGSLITELIEVDQRQRLEAELPRITVEFRQILLMTYRESLAPPEIAQRLGMPAVTVRKRLGRATDQLRRRFAARLQEVPPGAR